MSPNAAVTRPATSLPGAHPREALLLAHLPQVERIAAHVARRLPWAEREDFVGHVRLKLIEKDYAVLAKFEGRSRLTTYLTPVVRRLFIDRHMRRRGRWRASAWARRLGPLAERAEALRARDGLTRAEAAAVLRTDPAAPRDAGTLDALVASVPARAPRPCPQPLAPGDEPACDGGVELEARRRELAQRAARAGAALRAVLADLAPEEREALRLRFAERHEVRAVARALGVDAASFYSRLARLLRRLRETLEARGLTRDDARELLGAAELLDPRAWSLGLGHDRPHRLGERQRRPRTNASSACARPGGRLPAVAARRERSVAA